MNVNELKEIIRNRKDKRYRFLFWTQLKDIVTTYKYFVLIFSPILIVVLLLRTQKTLNILNFDGYNFGDFLLSIISLVFSKSPDKTLMSFVDRVNLNKISETSKVLWINIYQPYAIAYKNVYLYSFVTLIFGSIGLTTWFYNMYLKSNKEDGKYDTEIKAENIIEPEIIYEESYLSETHENGTQIGAMPGVILGNKHYQYQIGKLKIKPELVRLGWEGLRTHTLVTGTIGTGKTQFALYPITLQLLSFRPSDTDKKLGALFLDVKGDYYKRVLDFAKSSNRLDDVRLIELGGKYKYNPLHKPDMLAAELAARVIEIARTRDGGRNGNDAFWENQGKAFIENSIRLSRLHSNYVSFKIIDRIIRLQQHNELLDDIEVRFQNGLLTDDEIYTLEKLRAYFQIEIDQGREQTAKVMKIIEQTIQPMINSFLQEKQIEETFTPEKEHLNFLGFEEMINKGLIVVLKMDNATYPDLAPFIASYLALDFQKTTLQRIKKDTKLNVIRPLAFICDEVHFMMTQSWGEWLSVARQSNTAGVFATQSYQSLIEKMDEKIVSSIIQNINNKIWLRSEDKNTIEDVVRTAGKYEKIKETTSINETALKGGLDLTGGSIKAKKSNVALSTSITTEEKDRIRYDQFKNEMPDFTAFCSIARERTKDRNFTEGSKFNTLVYLNHWSKYGQVESVSEEEEFLLRSPDIGRNNKYNSTSDITTNSNTSNDIEKVDKSDKVINDKEEGIIKQSIKNIKERHTEDKIQKRKEKDILGNKKMSDEEHEKIKIEEINKEKLLNDKKDDVEEIDRKQQHLEEDRQGKSVEENKTKKIEELLPDETKEYVTGAKAGTAVVVQNEKIINEVKEVAEKTQDSEQLKQSVEKAVGEAKELLNEKDFFDF